MEKMQMRKKIIISKHDDYKFVSGCVRSSVVCSTFMNDYNNKKYQYGERESKKIKKSKSI